MIKHFLNPPNWFTSASIFCSTYAMAQVIAAHGDPDAPLLIRCCILVLLGGVFDMLDGRVARMTNRYSEFGVQLDSLADLTSFGIAPAMLAYGWKLHELGIVGSLLTFWYVLATAFRLARFNVNANHAAWKLAGHTQGLTSTMSGACLCIFIWISNGYMSQFISVPAPAFAALVGVLGLLLVSSVPYRSFKDIRRNRRARALFAFAVACCLAGASLLDPSMWFGVGATMYIVIGFFDGLITAAYYRRKGMHLDTVGENVPTAQSDLLPEDTDDDLDLAETEA